MTATIQLPASPTSPGTSTWAPVYVHPGHLGAGEAPASYVTILGSCVAVCLYDRVARIGGLNHFLLPTPGHDTAPSPRYGEAATEELIALAKNEMAWCTKEMKRASGEMAANA